MQMSYTKELAWTLAGGLSVLGIPCCLYLALFHAWAATATPDRADCHTPWSIASSCAAAGLVSAGCVSMVKLQRNG